MIFFRMIFLRMILFLMILSLTILFLPFRIYYWVAGKFATVRKWYYRNRPPPPMDIGQCHPLQEQHPGEHHITFVSRWDLAECGLRCPSCLCEAAARGEFAGLRTTKLGEVVVCGKCGQILVASPDTEHGDDLCKYTDSMHNFVRIAPERAMAEKYGEDIVSIKGDLNTLTKKAISWDTLNNAPSKETSP